VTNPPKVAEAIAKDEPQVEKLLIKVLKSDSEQSAALSLRGHDAELFMDVLQNASVTYYALLVTKSWRLPSLNWIITSTDLIWPRTLASCW
jgi:hypothetical protein